MESVTEGTEMLWWLHVKLVETAAQGTNPDLELSKCMN